MVTASQVTPRTQLKVQKIAVLTDFSQNADSAVRYAAAFARGCKASVVLAHAYIPPYAAFAAPEAALAYQSFKDLRDSLNSRLLSQAEAIYFRDIKCTTLLAEGTPRELLRDLEDVDLIVVGTSGEGGFTKAALGSTAETIFRSSAIPVLTVGPHCRFRATQEIALSTILYATDFSGGAELALPYAFSIASEHQAKLILLHVSQDKDAQFTFERTMASAEPLDKLHKIVADDIDKLIASGIFMRYKPTYIVGFGDASAVIVEEGKKHMADIIVMGARGAGAMASVVSHFGGGTAYRVSASADCPVLTIRQA